LLALAPSAGFGGGIERVAAAIEDVSDGGVDRIDLYDAGREVTPYGSSLAKARFGRSAIAAASRRRYRWILCLHAGLLPIALVAGRLTRTNVALFAYGTEVWAPMSAPRRRFVRACSRTIAISEFTAEWLARRAQVPRASVRIVRLPIAAQLAAAARDRPPPQDSREPIAVTVSRLVPEHRYKGYFGVLDAWRRVQAVRPDARWVVVGDGPDLQSLADRVRAFGLESSVRLVGRASDEALARVYREAAVFVLPSVADVESRPPTGEGFGLVYAEAGAFAVPSIASTAGGGASDFVVPGVTGLTVEPDDSPGLAVSLLDLLADPARRTELGKAARRRTLEYHLPDHFADQLRQILV